MSHDAPALVLGRSTGPIDRRVRLIAGILLIAFAIRDWKLVTDPGSFAFYGVVALTFMGSLASISPPTSCWANGSSPG